VVDEEGKRLEDAIRCGGLAATKAARIRAMLRDVRERRGKICLEYLRELSVDEVKKELSRFKGIGPKTVSSISSLSSFSDEVIFCSGCWSCATVDACHRRTMVK
jgi:endonuclease-3